MIGALNKVLDIAGGAMSGLQKMGQGLMNMNPMQFLEGFKQICQSAIKATQLEQGGAGGGGCPGLSMNPLEMLKRLFGGEGAQAAQGGEGAQGGGTASNSPGGGNPMQMLDKLIHDLGNMQVSMFNLQSFMNR